MTTRIGVKDMVFPLAQKQEDTLNLYTSDSMRCKIQRYCEYFRNVEEARTELAHKTFRAGAITGGIFGCIAAFFVISQDEEDGENKYIKATKVATYSFMGGAFLGSLFGGGYTVYKSSQLDPYLKWKVKVLPEKIFPVFRNFLENSGLREFMCPVTQDLIMIPVKDPKGRVYERSAIEYWINSKNNSPAIDLATLPTEADRDRIRFRTSPFCDMNLQMKDLKYDLDYHGKIVVILKKLHDQQIQQQHDEGLLAYRSTILKEREDLMGEIIGHIGKKHLAGEISEGEFSQVVKACKEHYNLLT